MMDAKPLVDYTKYENRLDSFKDWPKDSPPLIKELSDAGFYFCGESDLVACFICGSKIGGWDDNDSPLARHEAANRRCNFLAERAINQKIDMQNLSEPHESATPKDDSDDFGFDYLEKREKSIKKFDSKLLQVKVEQIANGGFFYNNSENVFECYCCHAQSDTAELLAHQDLVALHNPTCKHIALFTEDQKSEKLQKPSHLEEGASTPKVNDSVKKRVPLQSSQKIMKTEPVDQQQPKLKTSLKKNDLKLEMPSNVNQINAVQPVNASPDLLKAMHSTEIQHGYASAIPIQQSLFQKPLRPQPGLTPQFSHGDISPALSTPRALAFSENQILTPELSRQSSNWSMSSDDEVLNRECQSISPMQLSSKQAMLKTKYGRLQTFLTWPQDALIQPQELSEAGFYYTGEDDGVKCYACGVSLKNWEMSDNAWDEHKRWSPNCPLVREHMVRVANTSMHANGVDVSQQVRRQQDNVYHNIYDMTSFQNSARMQTSPHTFQLQPPFINSNLVTTVGFNNMVQGNLRYACYQPPGQDIMPVSPEGAVESPQVAPIGPLATKEIDTLLDAGFSIENINKVQELGFEKYGEYFDSAETMADAIMHFLENGNLNEHSLPDIEEGLINSEERNAGGSSIARPVDLKRELDKVREMQLCKICMDEQVGVAFHPCGHLFTCPNCSQGMQQCPVCRARIESTSRVYLS